MHKIFLPIYRFFKSRKALMYSILAVLTLFFAFFASKIDLEENLLKLFPMENEESRLAFEDLRVKDKLFIQILPTGERIDTWTLGSLMDEYMEGLVESDSSSHLIENVLYRLEDDMVVNGLGFALGHVPSFVDTSCYAAFDSLSSPSVLRSTMARNKKMLEADETGEISQMVTSDPLGMLPVIGKALIGDNGAPGGMTFVDGHLFCPDSTIVIAYISANFNSLNSGQGEKLVSKIEKHTKAFEAEHPEVEVLYHGSVALGTGHSRTIKRDLLTTLTISLLIVILVLLLSFRNGRILWQNIIPIVFGAIAALACMYMVKGGMSLMSLGLSAIILGIALSYCMHVTIHFNFVQSPSSVLKDESTPVILGCLTTVGAFMGLLLTESDMLRDFGLFASFALAGSTLFALVFLPHMLKPTARTDNKKVFGMIDRLSEYPFENKPAILIGVAIFVAVGIFFSPKVQFDNDMRNLDYIVPSVRRSMDLYEQKNFDGNFELYYATIGDTPDEAIKYSRILNRTLDSLKREGVLADFSGTVAEVYPTVDEQQERIQAWNAYWTPEKVEKTVRAVNSAALREGLNPAAFTPFKGIIQESYDAEDIYESGVVPVNLMANFLEKTPDGKYMAFTAVHVPFESQDDVTRVVTLMPHTIVLDPFWYCRDIIEVVHDDFNVALMFSSLLVLIILLVSFRNLWIALIAFMPMALSWYVVEGMMALLGIQFNLINIVISTFIFGVGVDYSIFVMEGLLGEARHGDKSLLSFHKTAIFFSALVLIIVMVSLMFATHPAISSIGTCTLIGMVTTIAITYTLEPWIFRKLLKYKYFRRSFKAREESAPEE